MRRHLDAPIAAAPLPHGISIAPFEIDVARSCRELMNAVYAEGFGDAVAFDDWWPRLTADADYDAQLMFVALAEGETVGFCHCWRDGFIKDIAVIEPFRRRGLGAALVTLALEECAARNAPHVDLKTDVDNVRAQSLYRRLGFEIVERVG